MTLLLALVLGVTTKIVPANPPSCGCMVTADAGPCAPAETTCECPGGSGYAIYRGYSDIAHGCKETTLEWKDDHDRKRVFKLWRKGRRGTMK